MVSDLEEFIRIDKRIDAAEEQVGVWLSESLRDRWEFGKLMLAQRRGKQLPKGKLDELVEATGKSKTELWFRAQFAERYSTEDEVLTAISTFGSWTQIKKSLPKPLPDSADTPRLDPAPKRHDRHDEVVQLRERGKSQHEIAEETGLGQRLVRHIVEREAIEHEASADAVLIAWDTIPGTAKEKLEAGRRQIRKELEKEFRARLSAEADQYRAQCDANVAAYKAQLDERSQKLNEMRNEERKRYQTYIEVARAKGLITQDDFNTIRSCLHPDSRMSVSDEKLAAAFRLFNDPKIKALLVKEK